MIKLLVKAIQRLNLKLAQYQQLCVDAENEALAMSCGAFNPQLLARIKRSEFKKT